MRENRGRKYKKQQRTEEERPKRKQNEKKTMKEPKIRVRKCVQKLGIGNVKVIAEEWGRR